MSTMEPPACLAKAMEIPHKLLLGPGPSNVPEEILAAMHKPLLGYLHPEFLQVMREASEGMRYLFQTRNRVTFAVSGTGHAGMEAALGNLLCPGDKVLVTQNGLWGMRAADIAERYGAHVTKIIKPEGVAFTLDDVEKALSADAGISAVFMVQGESSTGTLQPLEGFGALAHRHSALLIVDTVASLGATPFRMDDWEVDCVYSATQKALSAPPGQAPISFSERAWQKVVGRTDKVRSFYLDMVPVANYWGCDDSPPRYHHTGMVSLTYALRAALARIAAEGLDESVARHRDSKERLHKGLADLGLQLFVPDPAHRLPTLTTVCVPAGVDWAAVIKHLMDKHLIEIAGGLGATAGKIWRIGLMGHNSRKENVDRVLMALKEALDLQGFQKGKL